MSLAHYPTAVTADRLIADIERRLLLQKKPFGYECLFITEKSTRPSMELEVFPEILESPDWRDQVTDLVSRAKRDATDDEVACFEPYGEDVP